MSTKVTRADSLKGKTIKRVKLRRVKANLEDSRPGYIEAEQIEFTDGSTVTFGVLETGADYAVELWLHPKEERL